MPYSDDHNILIPPHPCGRTRYVGQQWVRDANGPLLPKPPPRGVRTPNGLIWGHDLTDFMWIKQFHDIDIFTVWSRSMIKEFGENYDATEWEEEDKKQVPRRRYPWPVLKLPKRIMEFDIHGTQIGIIDKGCEKHHLRGFSHQYRDCGEDMPSEKLTKKSSTILAILKKLFPNLKDDEALIVANDGKESLEFQQRFPYSALWADSVRSSLEIFTRQTLPFSCHNWVLAVDVTHSVTPVSLDDLRLLSDPSVMFLMDGNGLVDLTEISDEVSKDKPKRSSRNAGGRNKRTSKAKSTKSSSSRRNETDKYTKEERDELRNPPFKSPFSIEKIPKLEEPLPRAFFPDVITVHDPHRVVFTGQSSRRKAEHPATMKYVRVLPKFPGEDEIQKLAGTTQEPKLNVAQLYLHQQHQMGTGHHSAVFQAPLTLPPPVSAHSRNGNVTVAAKLAFPNHEDRYFLNNEATVYSKFPGHLMEDWCGYNFVPPVKHPVPVRPVVPRFYGYYLPEGTSLSDALESDAPSPILLMEECGQTVQPDQLSLDEQSECLSLMHRLHKAGVMQGSAYIRNMVVQPGPLTAPPEKRSRKTPSFRIIDFGRGQYWDDLVGENPTEEHLRAVADNWYFHTQFEAKRAQDDLKITPFES